MMWTVSSSAHSDNWNLWKAWNSAFYARKQCSTNQRWLIALIGLLYFLRAKAATAFIAS